MRILFLGWGAKGHMAGAESIIKSLAVEGHEVHVLMPRGIVDLISYQGKVEEWGTKYYELPDVIRYETMARSFMVMVRESSMCESINTIANYIINPKTTAAEVARKDYSPICHQVLLEIYRQIAVSYIMTNFELNYYDLLIYDALAGSAHGNQIVSLSGIPPVKLETMNLKGIAEKNAHSEEINKIGNFVNTNPELKHFMCDASLLKRNFVEFKKEYESDESGFTVVSGPKGLYGEDFEGEYKKIQEAIYSEDTRADQYQIWKLVEHSHLFLGNRELPKYKENEKDSFWKENFSGSKDQSRVYISLGTELGNLQLFKNIVDHFRDADNYQVLFSAGGNDYIFSQLNKHIDMGSSNIHIKKFVNQTKILHVADVFITHAGANGIYEAIWYKTPMLLFPQGADQPWNANIIQTRGLGNILTEADIIILKEKITEVQGGQYRSNLFDMSQNFKNSQTGTNIVEQIVGILQCNPEKLMDEHYYSQSFDSTPVWLFTMMQTMENRYMLEYLYDNFSPLKLDNSKKKNLYYSSDFDTEIFLHFFITASFAFSIKSVDIPPSQTLIAASVRTILFTCKKYFSLSNHIEENTYSASLSYGVWDIAKHTLFDAGLTLLSYGFLLPYTHITTDLFNNTCNTVFRFVLTKNVQPLHEMPQYSFKEAVVDAAAYVASAVTFLSLYKDLPTSHSFQGLSASIQGVQKIFFTGHAFFLSHIMTKSLVGNLPDDVYDWLEEYSCQYCYDSDDL